MHKHYSGVETRFLRDDERLVLSDEHEMPLVIEACEIKTRAFLHQFLEQHAQALLTDIAHYGAVLLRGFEIDSDKAFEETILKIPGFRPIADAFMSEEGRIHVDGLQYVLFTNAVYKTGGTMYLGGFHSENYYSTDVPAYICFCCLKPSEIGGETGLVNMEKVYEHLDSALKEQLEQKSFFVCKWRMQDVIKRYSLSEEEVEKTCKQFGVPILGTGAKKFILLYKPSVYEHPVTHKKSLQVNFFEIRGLNTALRKCFMRDYQGKTWFWHRFVWQLPKPIFKFIKAIYVSCSSFFYSPKDSFAIFRSKITTRWASRFLPSYRTVKVGSAFDRDTTDELARRFRQYYVSCLWKSGDILLVDNRKVVHAGMPGSGNRLVRAIICNPLDVSYEDNEEGVTECTEQSAPTLGAALLQK